MDEYVSFCKIFAKPMTWLEFDVQMNGDEIYVTDGGEPVNDYDGYMVITEIDDKSDYITWISKEVFNKMYHRLQTDKIM